MEEENIENLENPENPNGLAVKLQKVLSEGEDLQSPETQKKLLTAIEERRLELHEGLLVDYRRGLIAAKKDGKSPEIFFLSCLADLRAEVHVNNEAQAIFGGLSK